MSKFLLGGLLSGLGAGLQQEAAQRREDALIALRRQFQQEDQATAQTQTIAAEERAEERDVRTDKRRGTDLSGRTSLLRTAGEIKQRENESDQQFKERMAREQFEREKEKLGIQASNARELAVLQNSLGMSRDAADRSLAAEIERGKAKVIGVDPDGYIIVQRGDVGLITTRTKMDKSAGGGGSVLDQVRGGTPTPTPARTPARAATPAISAMGTGTAPGKAALQASLDLMLRNGQLGPGSPGETVTAPAGALAPTPVVIEWDGERWVPAT